MVQYLLFHPNYSKQRNTTGHGEATTNKVQQRYYHGARACSLNEPEHPDPEQHGKVQRQLHLGSLLVLVAPAHRTERKFSDIDAAKIVKRE
jgi:hypothetical protein|mmetsp:Transcript_4897/g.7780  ORF Transcript_4897/g.7780 Transcript_4897/m.7780 type:complete len:91 (-) Transcript_4897:140-412(-)